MTEKQKIGNELRVWLDKDPQYCMILIPMALQMGVITEEQAEICKADLELYYQARGLTNKHRTEAFAALMPILGFSRLKILYNMVEQLPYRHAGGTAFYSDDKAITKKFDGMGSIAYYKYVNDLCDMGYIIKSKREGKKVYIIDFGKLENEYQKTVKNNRIE